MRINVRRTDGIPTAVPELEPQTVALVLERHATALVASLANRTHLWLIDTPENRAVATEIWTQTPPEDCLDLTLFKESDAPCDEVVAVQLGEIELHYGEWSQTPGWNRLEVYGARVTERIVAALEDTGFELMEDSGEGFKAIKVPAAV